MTDGEHNAALAVVRSLGRAGCSVYVCSSRRRSLAAASRYATAHEPVADPLREPRRHAHEVHALARRWRVDVVLPVSEAALLAVLPERESFDDVVIPFPALADFQRASDKQNVARIAESLGIRVPAQRVLVEPPRHNAGDLEALKFPLVAKPARSVVGSSDRRSKTGVVHVQDADALRTVLAGTDRDAYPILLQERIVGPGAGVFLLMWNGAIRAAFAHRRIREKPPSGGVSVCSESVPLDSPLLDSSAALLRALDWNGVAMIEYKMDALTATPFLMEINGRFWGSLQLAVDAGVDFPALLVAAALGEDVRSETYRAGLRSRWFWGDVDHLLARVRRSRRKLALPPDAPGLGTVISDFMTAFGPRHRSMIFRMSDPAPALRETIDWLRRR